MNNPKMAAAMRQHWADAEWRERQLARIAEAKAKHVDRVVGRRLGRAPDSKVAASISLAPAMFEAVKAIAIAEQRSFSEIVRYIEWGLENEGAGDYDDETSR